MLIIDVHVPTQCPTCNGQVYSYRAHTEHRANLLPDRHETISREIHQITLFPCAHSFGPLNPGFDEQFPIAPLEENTR